MIKYVNIILGVMILIMCFLSSSNQTIYAQDNLPKDKFIYGIWLSEKISRGGFKSILEFKKNGVFLHRRSVWLDFKYKVDNTSITLIPTNKNPKKETLKGNIQINDDKLELKLNGENLRRMERVDNWVISSNSKYIGQWSFNGTSGATEYYIFEPKGNLLVRIPMPGETTLYFSIIENIIEMKGKKDESSKKMKWRIRKDGLLILQDIHTDKSWSYRRFIE